MIINLSLSPPPFFPGNTKKRAIPPLVASVSHGLIPHLHTTSVSRFKVGGEGGWGGGWEGE